MRISEHIVPVVLFVHGFAFAYRSRFCLRRHPGRRGGSGPRRAGVESCRGRIAAPSANSRRGRCIAASPHGDRGPSIPRRSSAAAVPRRRHPWPGLTALEYAAANGQAEAGWKLARMYADGDGVREDDLRAFEYFRGIADAHAEEPPGTPQARFVANAFVALGIIISRVSRIDRQGGSRPRPRDVFLRGARISAIPRRNIASAGCISTARAALKEPEAGWRGGYRSRRKRGIPGPGGARRDAVQGRIHAPPGAQA